MDKFVIFQENVKECLRILNLNCRDIHNWSNLSSGFYAEYLPGHPEATAADFVIYQDLNGSVSVHGNLKALVPTIKAFNSFEDFLNWLNE